MTMLDYLFSLALIRLMDAYFPPAPQTVKEAWFVLLFVVAVCLAYDVYKDSKK